MSNAVNTEEFIKRSQIIHKHDDGTPKYDYSKSVYKNTTTKITIICPTHGEFEQVSGYHLQGNGCKKCNGNHKLNSIARIIEAAKKIHIDGDGNLKYNYSKAVYKNSKTKITIICPIHGEFEQRIHVHLNGSGCQECARISRSNIKSQFVIKAQQLHKNLDGTPKYLYDKVKYDNRKTKVIITCPLHGDFTQRPSHHLSGNGCPTCGGRETLDNFISKSNKIHKRDDGTPKYDYSKSTYTTIHEYTTIICPTHGEFIQTPSNHMQGAGCPKCSTPTSKSEIEVLDYIMSVCNHKLKTSDRTILNGKELDILIPSLGIAFEFNGIYWHSDHHKPISYHASKTDDAMKKGIRLYHISEWEWINKRSVWESKISLACGCVNRRIHARKCVIQELTPKESNSFLDANHLQGGISSKVKLGMYFEGELVSVMTFSKPRMNKN